MSTYYAGIGGNDANSGATWALRKLTIQAAVNVATTAGDTIYVGSGVYRETVTFGTSGTAGNVISLIGDYTGVFTGDAKGIVRITGSADDIALTRANCISATSKNYITVSGFQIDMSSGAAVLMTSCTHITISNCAFHNKTFAVYCSGTGQSNVTISRCYVSVLGGPGILFTSTLIDDRAHLVENCIVFVITGFGIQIEKVGGVIVRNCTIFNDQYSVICHNGALNAGQTATVNNCVFFGGGVYSTVLGYLVEDYNTFWTTGTARTNVTAGANSVSRSPLFDTRWFFEAVNGGRLVTPFDLASYSTLVEYNSGTGAPSTDMRGASVVGTYREWGPLEYDANHRIGGPVSIAPIGGIG